MALVPSFAASEIFLALRAIAGLDADGNAIYIPPPPPPIDIPAVWAEEYNSYAKMGVIPGAENTGSNTAGIEAAIRAGVNNNETEIKNLALVMATYWHVLAVTPSIPTHGGSIVISVSNDSLAHRPLFEDAVRASIDATDTVCFLALVGHVESMVISQMTWTVTELVPSEVPEEAATEVEFYEKITGLNYTGPTNCEPDPDPEPEPDPEPPAFDFPSAWATAYDNYGKAGVVLGAINEGGNKGALDSFLRGGVNNDDATITAFAVALASYWADVALIPGDPAHGGISVVSVANDAGSQVSAFESAIRSSMTSSRSEPFFKVLIENIQNIGVSAITWTVTEVVLTPAPVPTDFLEKIS